ncbi:MAG TPA: c-type cytochrome [Nevskiaceae bacterium]|nr:c-type cytochrome [Nevskiaceae bacterium]
MKRCTLLLALLLCACGGDKKPAASAPLPPPADPALAKVFDSTCRTCHANPASGAPQAGDTAAWSKRVAQGKDTLLTHTMSGFQSMPPMGLCMQCDEAQFTALIEYMSGAKLQ